MIIMVASLFGAMAGATPAHDRSRAEPNENADRACGATADRPGNPPFCGGVPSLTVTSSGPSSGQGQVLADELGLPLVPLAADGALRWLDPATFQHVPTDVDDGDPARGSPEDDINTTIERVNFSALAGIAPMDPDTAVAMATAALEAAGLMPPGAQVSVGHSNLSFEGSGTELNQLAAVAGGTSFLLDTHVSFTPTFNDIPVIGPGAKVKMVFDGQGRTTQLLYSMRGLSTGPSVQVIAAEDVGDACADAYAATDLPGLTSSSGPVQVTGTRMVYYAPSLELGTVETLYPHLECQGEVQPIDGQSVALRPVIVPAVQDLPAVELTAESTQLKGSVVVHAVANVTGGTPPFMYQWTALSTPFFGGGETDENEILYQVFPRFAIEEDTVIVHVTDANGLQVSAETTVPLTDDGGGDIIICCTEPAGASPQALGTVDVGTEWVGESQGLGGSAGNAGGWIDENLARGTPVAFDWGNYNAWEPDFKDPVFPGGDDSDWVDNVDMVFYTGHANAWGWTFPLVGEPTATEDGFLAAWEAKFGNRDLEWLVIAACGPMQAVADGQTLSQRWGPALDRLHILFGYATVSYDNQEEGRKMARYMHGTPGFWFFGGTDPLRLRHAWAQTATDVQPDSVLYSSFGPIRNDGAWNFNDHFWGRGTVGPDIADSQTSIYWIIRAPS